MTYYVFDVIHTVKDFQNPWDGLDRNRLDNMEVGDWVLGRIGPNAWVSSGLVRPVTESRLSPEITNLVTKGRNKILRWMYCVEETSPVLISENHSITENGVLDDIAGKRIVRELGEIWLSSSSSHNPNYLRTLKAFRELSSSLMRPITASEIPTQTVNSIAPLL